MTGFSSIMVKYWLWFYNESPNDSPKNMKEWLGNIYWFAALLANIALFFVLFFSVLYYILTPLIVHFMVWKDPTTVNSSWNEPFAFLMGGLILIPISAGIIFLISSYPYKHIKE